VSKWLPDPDKPTKQPLKVRFKDTPPGSPEARVLEEKLQPQISHFLRSRVQNRQLTISEVHKVRGNYPGLRMAYTYNHGQEILDIEVTTSLRPTTKPEVPSIPYDWALIDFTLLPFAHDYADTPGERLLSAGEFRAKMRVPVSSHSDTAVPFAGSSGIWGEAFDHVASFDPASPETPPILQFGGSIAYSQVGSTVTESADHEQVSSLLVDVRNFHTFEEVVVEIYGAMGSLRDDNVPVLAGKTLAAYSPCYEMRDPLGQALWVNPLSGYSRTDIFDMYPTVAQMVGDHSADVGPAGTFPFDEADMTDFNLVYTNFGSSIRISDTGPGGPWSDTVVANATAYFSPEIDGATEPLYGDTGGTFGPGLYIWQYVDWFDHSDDSAHIGPVPALPPHTDPGGVNYDIGFLRHVFIFTPTYDTAPVPITPSSTCDVSAAMFRGTPPWAWSQHEIPAADDLGYDQWEITSDYPDRIHLGTIGEDVSLELNGSDPANEDIYGLKLLGTLHIFPKLGGVNFNRVVS
jgi:hypothetical protein